MIKDLFYLFTHTIFIASLGWYLITNLQWYNYKIQRVIFNHHKRYWHVIYFILPIAIFYILDTVYFYIYFYILFLPVLLFWHKKLDKPLVVTTRVKRFLYILFFITIILNSLYLAGIQHTIGIFVPLIISLVISSILEKIFFISFKHKAKKRLHCIENLKIIAITASYGKTSIKNYLFQILNKKYNTYMTPRSVNTIGGLIKDINNDLPTNTHIYIAEAGARAKGDIAEIASLLEHQYAVIGSVGKQHIEYFKTLDNIIYTKMEILQSKKLKHGFVHNSVPILKYNTITKFPNKLKIIKNSLDGITFDIEINNKIEQFSSPVLGSFNAINLTAAILVSLELDLKLDEIKEILKNIKPVAHRLCKNTINNKIIIDDSFNGNLEGMIEAINICSKFDGKKIIVTPGLVESTIESNIKLAKEIDNTFDLVIITGTLNAKILQKFITKSAIILLKEKKDLEDILSKNTNCGDLILFANDAPNFI